MNDLESALLDELTDGGDPELLVRSRTRIDAGRWWRHNPVWICITKSELILFAVARRRFVERLPLADCRECHYLAATGELVIDSTDTLLMKRIKLTPREALNVLDFLKNNNHSS